MKKRNTYINIVCKRARARMGRVFLWLNEAGLIELSKREMYGVLAGSARGYNRSIVEMVINEADSIYIKTRALMEREDKSELLRELASEIPEQVEAVTKASGAPDYSVLINTYLDKKALRYITERLPVVATDMEDEVVREGVKVGNERLQKMANIAYRVYKTIRDIAGCERWLMAQCVPMASLKAYMYGQRLTFDYKQLVKAAVVARKDRIVIGCDAMKIAEEIYDELEGE